MNDKLEARAHLASLLVDEAHDALIALSADGERRVLLWNPSATTLFGRKSTEALGQRITDLGVLEASDAGLLAGIDCCDAIGSNTIHTFTRADDVPITCAVRCRLVEAEGKRVIALSFGAARGRVLAESSDVSDSYFRDLLDAAPDAMVIVTPDGSIQLINAQFERLFGYSRRDLLGEPIEIIVPERYRAAHPAHRNHYFLDPHARPMGNGMMLHARRKDGTEFPAEISLAPLQSTQALLVMATIRDVTDRVKTEQTLREAKDAAEAAGLAKTRFLANMSHEIRTPLTALLGFADLMLDPRLGESERLNYALTIRRNGEHLLSVLNDILDVSMVEAGKLSIESLDFSINELLTEVASLTRVRAIEKGLSFNVEYETPVPSLLRSDPTRVRQILLNLVSNAVKFTSEGGVRVLVRCEAGDEHDAQITVQVVDTGIGIAEEKVKYIFEPFAQADASMTRRFGGSGLGLAISGLLAQAMGGRLDVASTERRGSTFTLTLPIEVVKGSVTLRAPSEAIADTDARQVPEAARLHGRILLAEDGPDNQRLISKLLSASGIEVAVVENGLLAMTRALEAARAGRPFDLILMDMQMPELDGYGATSRLRASGYQGAIVALTAHAMAGERERCLAAGCDDYLTKPITRAELTRAVSKYLKEDAQVSAGLPRNAVAQASEGSSGNARTKSRGLRSPVPKDETRTRATERESERSQARAPAPVAPEAPAVLKPRLVSAYADDPDLGQLVASFVTGLPGIVSALRAALSRDERAEVVRIAHQLKGAAGGYGFPSITSAAARIEAFASTSGTLSEDILEELSQLCVQAQPCPEPVVEPAARATLPIVLAIDDSSHIHALLAARLSSEQLTLRRAMSAREGLQLAFSSPPDLILLDLDLPDTSGFVVCRELKADSRTSNVPVLFLTGSEDSALKAAAFDLGAVDYITKPFEPTELKARVRAALRTKRYQDLLATRSQLDALTGLWNRGYFDQRLEEEVRAASRHSHPLCVAIMDLDHFKRVNDTYGHPFGDQVLQTFASVMAKALRTSDVACRYGGEEFALILRDTPPDQGMTVAERLRQAIAHKALSARGEEVRVTVSIGLSYLESKLGMPSGEQARALVQAADAALYQAKRSGRDRVVRGEPA